MNSIAKAINNVALSLSRIASALESKKIEPTPISQKKVFSNLTETSNPNYTKVTSTITAIPIPVTAVPKNENQAFDAIYNTLVNKGTHPDHYDSIMREIKTKWPTLWQNLQDIIKIRSIAQYPSNQYGHDHKIWK